MTQADLVLTLDGGRFDDIAGFYAEVNRVFMAGEDWQLGQSLDALEDLLYGGYGVMQGHSRVDLIWQQLEKSRADLGLAATRAWLEGKLAGGFDSKAIRQQLAALERGEGPLYIDIVLEIIAGHKQIRLIRR